MTKKSNDFYFEYSKAISDVIKFTRSLENLKEKLTAVCEFSLLCENRRKDYIRHYNLNKYKEQKTGRRIVSFDDEKMTFVLSPRKT